MAEMNANRYAIEAFNIHQENRFLRFEYHRLTGLIDQIDLNFFVDYRSFLNILDNKAGEISTLVPYYFEASVRDGHLVIDAGGQDSSKACVEWEHIAGAMYGCYYYGGIDIFDDYRGVIFTGD